ncbi:hypothetical protein QAD02_002508 [Eretmocerus hayati]|uniref:Uncharacterized protein n=1 Tax=Eretmocerus hayati TaxID=131215 RepID=A0ACC2NJE0_9HYME|nr:hypothetical protein QAD02_002508 [Eretmocerus hayati]
MVIVSGGWNHNVPIIPCEKRMSATGILICHDNSHPFQERTLSFENPIKIGRSVARARAAVDNAIFDCKVLSRNHAILWYESGKFYLKDTKSSNGTFVNNKRLSPSGEDSIPFRVSSGDIVQFGVDVVDSTKKVTHGCIVSSLKLYMPDGTEAKNNPPNTMVYVNITMEDLYKLNQFIQEAGRRENALRSKLDYMQQLLDYTRMSVNQSWKSLILEDCLISRLEMLENQVATYSKSRGAEDLKLELLHLLEDKLQYQNSTRMLMQNKVQEKRDFVAKLQILKYRLSETEEDSRNLHSALANTQTELQELAIKYVEVQQKLQDTNEEFSTNMNRLEQVLKQAEDEKKDLADKLEIQRMMTKNLESDLKNPKLDTINMNKIMTALHNSLQASQKFKSSLNKSLIREDGSDYSRSIAIPGKEWDSEYFHSRKKHIWSADQHSSEVSKTYSSTNSSSAGNLQNDQCHSARKFDSGYELTDAISFMSSSFSIQDWAQFFIFNKIIFDNIPEELIANFRELKISNLMNNTPLNKTTSLILPSKDYSKTLSNVNTSPMEYLVEIMRHEFLNPMAKEDHSSGLCRLPGSVLDRSSCMNWSDVAASETKYQTTECLGSDSKIICSLNDGPNCGETMSPRTSFTSIFSPTKLFQQNIMQALNIFGERYLDPNLLTLSKQSDGKSHLSNVGNAIMTLKHDDYIQFIRGIQVIEELSEQLVILKERYNTISEEKSSLVEKYVELETHREGHVSLGKMFEKYYMVPIFIVVILIVLRNLLQIML